MGIKKIVYLFACLLCFGCATTHPKQALKPVSTPPIKSAEGPDNHDSHVCYSLLQDTSPQGRLFADHRAMRVGDTLTVQIVESATASGKAQTSTSRKSLLSGALDNFFGIDLKGHNAISGKNALSFEGKGKTTQSDRFLTTITVQVVELLPGGNMKIEGKRDLTINNEHRYVILKGIVRPEDVSPDNVVLSTKVANAEVVYKGKGVIGRKQGPGWGLWLLNLILPF